MNKSRKWFSMGLAAVLLAGMALAYAPEAEAGVRVIRRSTCGVPGYGGGYGGGYCVPVYRPPVHQHSYVLQQQRVFRGYDHCGNPIFEIRYVQVRTCGCY